jgi:hypothetical protein
MISAKLARAYNDLPNGDNPVRTAALWNINKAIVEALNVDPDATIVIVKLSPQEIREVRDELVAHGYFATVGPDLRHGVAEVTISW